MNDFWYSVLKTVGPPPFVLSHNPVVLGLDNLPARGSGGCLLAANHSSYFDIPLLMLHYPYPLEYVAAAELFRHPFARWFYGLFNPVRYDRRGQDTVAVRELKERFERGRTIGFFPEGGIRHGKESVTQGGGIRGGLGRLAMLGQVPVIPVVMINTRVYYNPVSWLPVRRARYGISFGQPMMPPRDVPPSERRAQARLFEDQYCRKMCVLYEELYTAMQNR